MLLKAGIGSRTLLGCSGIPRREGGDGTEVVNSGVEHRFAIILCADVVGYSRLMGIDEEGTLAVLQSIRRDLVDPNITENNGRIVRTMGDGLLVEFSSVIDAVRCAVGLQRAMHSRRDELPADRRIRYRVGLAMGDVVTDGDLIYGRGVDIASRLERLAEPGGINVTRAVRDQVRDQLPIVFEDLGEHEVKNVARPVRVFRIAPDRDASVLPTAAVATRPAAPAMAV